jgi:hypothetical protein
MRHRSRVSIVVALALSIVTGESLGARGGQQLAAEAESTFAVLVQKVQAASEAQVQKGPPSGLEAIGLHGFSVALVLGDMQGSSTTDNVPGGAKKALADMRDFLPYKSYKLIDAQWLLCCGGSVTPMTSVSGRLRGAAMPGSMEEQEYAFTVSVTAATGSKLSIRFSLRDATTAGKFTAPTETFLKYGDNLGTLYLVQMEENSASRLEAEKELTRLREQFGPNSQKTKEAEQRLAQLQQRGEQLARTAASKASAESARRHESNAGSGKAIIDSTFSMEVGETVVIGTSSLKGDKALIALLTAAQRPPRVAKTEQR